MAELKTTNIVKIAGKDRVLNVRPDLPDIRDRMYEPDLIRLEETVDNRNKSIVTNQGSEGSCTGHGLAAVIDNLNVQRGKSGFRSSRRMLYEMAQKYDEWPGQDYEGSSCRGAIRGWKSMGVCSEEDWPYKPNKPGDLTVLRAKAARENTLGAYYRLRPEISDYHAAITRVGAIYVSAKVHEGWQGLKPRRGQDLVEIPFSANPIGGHAFAIVGYNEKGFIVQNSWGPDWGSNGFALWRYLDWIETIGDGWVFRLALSTPQIFGRTSRQALADSAESRRAAPRRYEIAGHFVHFNNGKYEEKGDYWSNKADVEETVKNLEKHLKADSKKYKHLLIYAHGGLNDPKASARRIAALKDGFKRNGVYPLHIMYDTGLARSVTDAVKRAFDQSDDRARGIRDWFSKLTDVSDKVIEGLVRTPVTPVWDEMKNDARWPFVDDGDGIHTIRTIARALKGSDLNIHMMAHSTGGVLLGHLLDALDDLGDPDIIHSCSLMAPACTLDFFKQRYEPRLGSGHAATVKLPKLNIYNLSDELERDDHVAYAYRKSLLYLVSRALERVPKKRILGMERYSKNLSHPDLTVHVSKGKKTRITRSESHGGFDNDPNTMNHVLGTILGSGPPLPFTEEEMKGY